MDWVGIGIAFVTVLGFLLVLILGLAGAAKGLSLLKGLLTGRSVEQEQRLAREALASFGDTVRGRLASGSEARLEGRLRGDSVELTYVAESQTLTIRLWGPPFSLRFSVERGFFGPRVTGPGARSVLQKKETPAFKAVLERLFALGWSTVGLERNAFYLRGCFARIPSRTTLRDSLEGLQRLGVVCETGGLLLSADGKGVVLCPFCRDELALDERHTCQECGTPLHTECWAENAGCVVFGCPALGIGRRRG